MTLLQVKKLSGYCFKLLFNLYMKNPHSLVLGQELYQKKHLRRHTLSHIVGMYYFYDILFK